jgi:hypothetical protein
MNARLGRVFAARVIDCQTVRPVSMVWLEVAEAIRSEFAIVPDLAPRLKPQSKQCWPVWKPLLDLSASLPPNQQRPAHCLTAWQTKDTSESGAKSCNQTKGQRRTRIFGGYATLPNHNPPANTSDSRSSHSAPNFVNASWVSSSKTTSRSRRSAPLPTKSDSYAGSGRP